MTDHSEVVDRSVTSDARDALELARRYVDGYVRVPVDVASGEWVRLPRAAFDDDVDWAALYEECS